MIYTKSQNKALRTDANIAVTAGAGSGKTAVLSRRYVDILKGQIANKEKPDVTSILAITFSNKAATEMQSRIRAMLYDEANSSLNAAERNAWHSAISQLSSAHISTIHSLCSSFLRRNAFVIGLNPNFTVLEEFTAKLYFRESADTAIAEISDGNPRQKIYQDLSLILKQWKKAGIINFLETCNNNRYTAEKFLRDYSVYSPEEIRNGWQQSVENGTEVIKNDAGISLSPADDEAIRLLKAFAGVNDLVQQKYKSIKDKNTCLDFNDLEILTLSSFENREAEPAVPAYRYFMVDEFQDTNSVQWKIIQKFIENSPDPNIFLVGDPKQSIYGFRNADVSVFASARNELSTGHDGNSIVFQENFRSLSTVTNFVNHFFSKLFSPPKLPCEVEYDSFIFSRSNPDPGSVNIILSETDEKGKPDLVKEAELAAKQIRSIVLGETHSVYTDNDEPQAAKWLDIALLFRTRKHIGTYTETFRKYEIPFYLASGTGFFEQQEIFDILNTLSFLSNLRDDVSFAGTLRSPLFNISDNLLYHICNCRGSSIYERFINAKRELILKDFDIKKIRNANRTILNWKNLANRIPVSKMIDTILKDTGGWCTYSYGPNGDQKVKNIEKLINIALLFEESDYSTIADFLEYVKIRAQNSEEGDAPLHTRGLNAVKIMTIHATKGLEFPIVFLPDLNSTFRSESSSFLIEKDTGIGMKISETRTGKSEDTAIRKLIKLLEVRKQNAESKRLFYVACTRARDHLFLCCSPEEMKKEPEHYRNDNSSSLSRYYWLKSVYQDLGAGETKLSVNKSNTNDTFTIQVISEPFTPGVAKLQKSDAALKEKLPSESPGDISKKILTRIVQQKQEFQSSGFTVTGLQTYEICPNKYFMQFILKFPVFDEIKTSNEEHFYHSRVNNWGEIAHEFFTAVDISESHNRGIDIQRILEKYHIPEQEFPRLSERLKTYEGNFSKSDIIAGIKSPVKEYNEMDFIVKCGIHKISGRFDKLIHDNSGSIHLIDFKTYNISAEKVKEISEMLYLQIAAYVYAADKIFTGHHFPIHGHFYFPEPDIWHTYRFEKEDLEKIERKLLQCISFVLNKDFFIPYDVFTKGYIRDKCFFCPIGRCDFCKYVSRDEITRV